MPSSAQVEQVRRALDKLATAARGDWQKVYDSLRISDRVLMTKALRDGWVGIVEQYGDMAATLGVDIFQDRAADIGIRPKVKQAAGVNERQAMGNLGYALTTPDQLGSSLVAIDRLVLQPYRDTMQQSAWASGGAWARVPGGREPCAFCLMLASRGAVYQSAESAGDGAEYHGDCRCVPELVRDSDDYPDGYDPDALYDAYSTARQQAGSGSTGDILAELRKQQGTH